MRSILICNESTTVSDHDVQIAVEAMRVQGLQFAPFWGVSATLTFHKGKPAPGVECIHVMDTSDQANALGYHLLDTGDFPEGFVFAKTTRDYGEAWTTTLSHEFLEQLVDPWCNALALCGPFHGHPQAGIALEVCDPVEGDSYPINIHGVPVEVSNFALPLWFTNPPLPLASKAKVDYLGRLAQPLGMTPGGYIAYTLDLTNWQEVFGRLASPHDRAHGERHHSRHNRRLHRSRGRHGNR